MRFNDGEISSTWKKNLSLDFFLTQNFESSFLLEVKWNENLKKGFLWKKVFYEKS